MYDHELVFDIFKNIGSAIEQIQKRFEPIKVSSDFIKDDAGLDPAENTGQGNWIVYACN